MSTFSEAFRGGAVGTGPAAHSGGDTTSPTTTPGTNSPWAVRGKSFSESAEELQAATAATYLASQNLFDAGTQFDAAQTGFKISVKDANSKAKKLWEGNAGEYVGVELRCCILCRADSHD